MSGMSFDHVCFNDGYIEPCIEPFGESQVGLIGQLDRLRVADYSESKKPSSSLCHGDGKVQTQCTVDVLQNEQTFASSIDDSHLGNDSTGEPMSSSL